MAILTIIKEEMIMYFFMYFLYEWTSSTLFKHHVIPNPCAFFFGAAAVPDGEGAGGGPGEQHHGGPGHHHLPGLRPAGPIPPAVPPQPGQEQGQAAPVRTPPHVEV